MKKKLQVLIKKLGKKYPYYDISTKNFMAPEVEEKCLEGVEVVNKTHTVVVQLTIFEFRDGKEQAIIVKKVDGVSEGRTRAEAVENATIEAIHTVGVN